MAELLQDGAVLATSVTPFAPNKHLELTRPGLSVVMRKEKQQAVVAVTAQTLARFVELKFEGADVVLSDNYFDVPAGRTVVVTCPIPAGWTVARMRKALQVQSLYESFAPASSYAPTSWSKSGFDDPYQGKKPTTGEMGGAAEVVQPDPLAKREGDLYHSQ